MDKELKSLMISCQEWIEIYKSSKNKNKYKHIYEKKNNLLKICTSHLNSLILEKHLNSPLLNNNINPTASFILRGYDIVRHIHLKDQSGKILECINLNKGDVSTGAFALGYNSPKGQYIIEIIGTHYPIVRGKVWAKGKEDLQEKRTLMKENAKQPIVVLIDFLQDYAESPWYPNEHDNPTGKETTTSLTPLFGIKRIDLMRSNSKKPVNSWSITPEKFRGQIKVLLTDDDEHYGKYPDDVYYFQIFGYNKGETMFSFKSEKIDELTFILNWETKAPPIPINIDIDFDPRWIYFIHDEGDEEPIQIPGERPYMTEVSYVTSDILTKRLKLGKYKIKVTGVGENQKNKIISFKKTYHKLNLYSRFDVSINITDKDLRDERDMNQIVDQMITLGNNW